VYFSHGTNIGSLGVTCGVSSEENVGAITFSLFLQAVLPFELHSTVGERVKEYYISNASFALVVDEAVSDYVQYEKLRVTFMSMRKNNSSTKSRLMNNINRITKQAASVKHLIVATFAGADQSLTTSSSTPAAGRATMQLRVASTDVAAAIAGLGQAVIAKNMGTDKSPSSIFRNIRKSVDRTRRDQCGGDGGGVTANDVIIR
jgi:hypothetical protein